MYKEHGSHKPLKMKNSIGKNDTKIKKLKPRSLFCKGKWFF